MILVVIPYYKAQATIQKTVKSILKQSYRDYEVLIVNDASGDDPREILPNDKRIKYFEMKENNGRYFIDAVVTRANPHQFYLPHDADDYSSYDRLFHLVRKQMATDADAVFHYQKVVMRTGRIVHETYPLLRKQPTNIMRHIAHHSALYKNKTLLDVGSYHPDFRVGYDTLLVNFIRMTSHCEITPRILYQRNIVDNSLTTSTETGYGSPYRKQQIIKLNNLYRKSFRNTGKIKEIVESSIKPETMQKVESEVKRLKKEMGW